MLKDKELDKIANNNQNIYISLDHLKLGTYNINMLLNGKIVKSIKINKK